MRADRLAYLLVALSVIPMGAAACGRVGYDPIVSADAGAGRGGGFAGAVGSGGAGGTSGAAGAAGTGAGGTAGSVGPGTGGTAGTTGAAGTTGRGGASGTGGGAAISCSARTFNGHDYDFCDAMVDWSTARAQCEQRGMRLARIDDAAENAWLIANATFSASMANRDALWIGGYEPVSDGDWHWTDGDAFWSGAANGMAVGGLFTNWDGREPNNAVGPEACLAIPLNKTTWFDWACTAAQYFACERY